MVFWCYVVDFFVSSLVVFLFVTFIWNKRKRCITGLGQAGNGILAGI